MVPPWIRKLNEHLRSILQKLLKRPVFYIARRFASSPQKSEVFSSLTELYNDCLNNENKHAAFFEIDYNYNEHRPVVLLSDQHKGNRGGSDDFVAAEDCYLTALDYYDGQGAAYINLGDSEELWKYTIFSIIQHNRKTFEAEKKFLKRKSFFKIAGNHDLFWRIDPLAAIYLKQIYGKTPTIYDGLVVRFRFKDGRHLDIFCTHGHQGDRQSDGNWFSKWFVSYIWAPLQSYLRININTPAHNHYEKTLHNELMYDWSAGQKNLVLITGHTHQPIFNSLSHLERLYLKLEAARSSGNEADVEKILTEIPRRKREHDDVHSDFKGMSPCYFNTGCCCYSDGTITGIEISGGKIRLIKWNYNQDRKPVRSIAEEQDMLELLDEIEAFKIPQ